MKKLLILLPLALFLITSCSKDDDTQLEQLATPTLTAPTNNVILAEDGFVFDFSWTQVTNATGYVVELADNTLFNNSSTLTVTSNNVEITINDAETGDYYWRVKATAPGFQDSEYANYFRINFTNTSNPTNLISLISPADNATVGTRPTFTWSELSGTSLYTVEVAQDFTFNSIFRTYQSVTNSYTIPGTAPEIPVGSYFWRVRRDTSTSNYFQINIQ